MPKSKSKTKKKPDKYGNPVLNAAADMTDAVIAISKRHRLDAEGTMIAIALTMRGLRDAVQLHRRSGQHQAHSE